MGAEIENCGRCGSLVYPFSTEKSASDGSSYCVKCAEEIDRQYLARNTCSMCTRLLEREEVKFVMPSRLYSNYFFDRLPIEYRLMCVKCYRRADRLNYIRQPLAKIWQIRARLGKTLVRKQIAAKAREN